MTHKDLIPILAKILGVPPKTAWVVDRSLANAGLRKKHKGPRPPDMTRLEALHFLLGCMVASDRPTKAGEEVARLANAHGFIQSGYNSGDEYLDEFAALGVEPPEDIVEANRGDVYFTNGDLLQVLQGVSDPFSYKGLDLFDILLRATRWAQNSSSIACENLRFEIAVSHNYALLTFQDRETPGSIHFGWGDDVDQASEYQINRSVFILGGALAAIAARTADPMEAAG